MAVPSKFINNENRQDQRVEPARAADKLPRHQTQTHAASHHQLQQTPPCPRQPPHRLRQIHALPVPSLPTHPQNRHRLRPTQSSSVGLSERGLIAANFSCGGDSRLHSIISEKATVAPAAVLDPRTPFHE